MAGQVLKGGVMGVTINGGEVQCELEASLSIEVTTTETDPCKPLSTENYKASVWSNPDVESKSWTITASAKAFADATAFNNIDLIKLLVDGDPIVQVQFYTKEHPDYDFDEIAVFSGSGILSLDSWDAPAQGESTYSFTITGKGKPTFVSTPVTP